MDRSYTRNFQRYAAPFIGPKPCPYIRPTSLTFAPIGPNVKSVMQRIAGPYRILSFLVLALSLHAVCPATDYNPRLELFNPTSSPVAIQRSQSVPPTTRVTWTETSFAISEAGADRSRPQFRQAQIVQGAIPLYQKTLPAANACQNVEDRYESSRYASCSIPCASGRGPPRLTA